MPRLGEEVRARILSLAGTGTPAAIARRVGVSRWSVARVLRAAGTLPPPRPTRRRSLPRRGPTGPRWETDPATGCRRWLGETDAKGRGRVWLGPGQGYRSARAWLYEREVGPIPPGAVLVAGCGHAWCVAPAHAKPVGRGELARIMRRPLPDEPAPDAPLPLRAIRRAKGLTQVALAAAVGADNDRLSAWDVGGPRSRARLTPASLRHLPLVGRVAAALGVDPLAVAEFRPLLLPEVDDLAAPRPGEADRRQARLPFVRWLRRTLAVRGWGAVELAAAVGCSRSAAHAWLTGAMSPQARHLPALREVPTDADPWADLAAWAAAERGARGPAVRGWSPEEEAVLLAHPELADGELAGLLPGRTAAAVAVRRSRLRGRGRLPTEDRREARRRAKLATLAARIAASPKPNRRRPWTAEEDGLLLAEPGTAAAELAARLGRTEAAVHQRRHRLRQASAPER